MRTSNSSLPPRELVPGRYAVDSPPSVAHLFSSSQIACSFRAKQAAQFFAPSVSTKPPSLFKSNASDPCEPRAARGTRSARPRSRGARQREKQLGSSPAPGSTEFGIFRACAITIGDRRLRARPARLRRNNARATSNAVIGKGATKPWNDRAFRLIGAPNEACMRRR